ncbi:TPA: hypothetical protein SMQ86_006057 [Pseudomonas aeruginosa]|nr:hypothetical protein [Pseudomonas aeruginosa]
MAILERALSKLTLEGFTDAELKTSVGKFKVLYNPERLQQSYEALYVADEAQNDDGHGMRFERMGDGRLSLPLVFDGLLDGNRTPVAKQLSALYALCGVKDARSGETRYLKVTWGAQQWDGSGRFVGRFSRLQVNQEVFDNDGTPLKASVALELVLDNPSAGKKKSSSGGLPNSGGGGLAQRIAAQRRGAARPGWLGRQASQVAERGWNWPAGETRSLIRAPYGHPLPLIAARTPGRSEIDYLDLALANGLTHLEAFEPGARLLWPEGEA